MAHKGIREFEPQELSSIALGQNGFTIMNGYSSTIRTYEAGVTSGLENIKYWVAIKAIDAAALVEARTLQGQGFTKDATKVYTGVVANDGLTISNGDIVYGCFDKIQIQADHHIIAYIGKLQ